VLRIALTALVSSLKPTSRIVILLSALTCLVASVTRVSTQPRRFYVSLNGDDRNIGTEQAPFRTLRKGASVLTPGATLYVMGGTYAESLVNAIPGGSSWASPVTVAAYPGHTVTVKPSSGSHRVLHFDGADRQYIVIDGLILDALNVSYDAVKITHSGTDVAASAHHIRIVRSEVRNAPSQGILVTGRSNSNEFLQLKVHDNGTSDFDHGIYIATDNNLVEGCEIFRNAGWGVHIYNGAGTTNRNVVRSNKIHNNGRVGKRGPGIGIYTGSDNVAYNNILWRQQIGIHLDHGANASIVANNTIYGHQDYGIFNGLTSKKAMIQNNIGYSNHTEIRNLGFTATIGYNLTDRDPQFRSIDTFDFRLRPISPAIGAGTIIPLVTTDFSGAPRPLGRPYTIGAFEGNHK